MCANLQPQAGSNNQNHYDGKMHLHPCERHVPVNPARRLATSSGQAARALGPSCQYQQSGRPLRTMAAAAVTAAGGQLTQVDLQRFIDDHGIKATFVHDDSKPVSDPDVIKSLVFMVRDSALLVMVLGHQQVCEKRVARHLGVARRRVRLASEQECLASSGFVPGTVPPCGHVAPLRTLVDVAVTQQTEVYGGGGHPDLHLQFPVAQLLQVTGAEVGLFAEQTAAPLPLSAGPPSPSWAEDAAVAALAAPLPVPWPPGSDLVRLVGVVAQRRRIAKLLQFVVLVPEDVPALPPGNQAAYLRRLWRHPVQGTPCEVQLIMGKTLERNLGREGAAALMERVKVGAIISLTGRVQPHVPAGPSAHQAAAGHDAPASPHLQDKPAASSSSDSTVLTPNSGTSGSQSRDGKSSSSSSSSAATTPGNGTTSAAISSSSPSLSVRPQVLDVVVHQLEVLFKNRDVLDRACLRAARLGFDGLTSAGQLQQLQRLGPSGYASSCYHLATGTHSSSEEDSCTSTASSSTDEEEGSAGPSTSAGDRSGVASNATAAAAAAGLTGSSSSSRIQRSSQSSIVGASRQQAAASAGDSPFWQLPLSQQHVHVVRDVAGVLHMQQCILGSLPGTDDTASAALGGGNNSSSSSSAAHVGPSSNGSASSYGYGLPPPTNNAPSGSSSSSSSSSRWCNPAWVTPSAAPLLLPGMALVGLDAEWLPYAKGEAKTPVAVLQLATRTEAFLVDLLALTGGRDVSMETRQDTGSAAAAAAQAVGTPNAADLAWAQQHPPAADMPAGEVKELGASPSPHSVTTSSSSSGSQVTPAVAALSHFLEQLLQHPQVVKLGFYMRNDLNRLQESYPWLPCYQRHPGGLPQQLCVDLADLVSHPDVHRLCLAQVPLEQRPRSAMLWSSRSQPPSLSRIVQVVLGRPLDKQQQRSDWAAGELSTEQVRYAVNDAHVLTQVYDTLVERHLAEVAAAAAGHRKAL